MNERGGPYSHNRRPWPRLMESQSSGEERAFGADRLQTSTASNCFKASRPLGFQAVGLPGFKASRLPGFWADGKTSPAPNIVQTFRFLGKYAARTAPNRVQDSRFLGAIFIGS